jgi:hypothetical protein
MGGCDPRSNAPMGPRRGISSLARRTAWLLLP